MNISVMTSNMLKGQGRAVLLAISFYWVVSIALVFLNKRIMSGTLDAPLFMTWTQIAVAVGCCYALSEMKKVDKSKRLDFFPRMKLHWGTAVQVMPLSIVFMGMIVFNNLCLKYVEVSFYHVARALSIVFNIALSGIVLGQSTSTRCLLAVVVVIAGYLLGCQGEIRFSMAGVAFGLLSSMFVALYSVLVKKTLKVVDDNSWVLMIYNNLNVLVCMPVLVVLHGELGVLSDPASYLNLGFIATVLLSGAFGFLINIASFLQIKMTSPLSHNVSGTAKAAVQTVLAYIVYQNPVTLRGILGIILVLGGSLGYAYFRKRDSDAAAKQRARMEMEEKRCAA